MLSAVAIILVCAVALIVTSAVAVGLTVQVRWLQTELGASVRPVNLTYSV